jgi:hypothetical protein
MVVVIVSVHGRRIFCFCTNLEPYGISLHGISFLPISSDRNSTSSDSASNSSDSYADCSDSEELGPESEDLESDEIVRNEIPCREIPLKTNSVKRF